MDVGRQPRPLDRDRRWTLAEWERLPDDGQRYELLDGRLYVSPAAVTAHQQASMNLAELLLRMLRDTGQARVFAAPYDVQLSSTRVVQPDLVVVATERAQIITAKRVVGVPDLLVEILSPSTRRRDRGVKRRVYAEAGVAEYWIVDPAAHTLDQLAAEGLPLVATYAEGRTVTSARFRGLAFPLSDVFRE